MKCLCESNDKTYNMKNYHLCTLSLLSVKLYKEIQFKHEVPKGRKLVPSPCERPANVISVFNSFKLNLYFKVYYKKQA